ncbi:hypothetical protein [Polaromonas sp.]|uniref:hypothetical protein n=1 Tax=Polaromonas sp. TaxID=1869339 RepID=UPI0032639CC8
MSTYNKHLMNQSQPHAQPDFHAHHSCKAGRSSFFDISLPSTAPAQVPKEMRRPLILQALQPSCAHPLIQAFIGYVFEDESALDAYFFPKQVSRHMPATSAMPNGPAVETLVPLEVARYAGLHAQSMSLVQPQERQLVNVATFLYPCSLFHLSRIDALSGPNPPVPTFDAVETMRALLLEESLHRLRCKHAGLGKTLAAVLGLPHDDDVQTDQVARLAAAVYLANLKVTALWTALWTEPGGHA